MAIWDDQFGGGLPQLAPDLTYPSDKASSTTTYRIITSIDATAGLTTALALSGKWSVSNLYFSNMTTETVTIKLTVDDVVVWNDTFTSGTSERLLGATSVIPIPEAYGCKSSFLLEIQTATDNNIQLQYLARPLL